MAAPQIRLEGLDEMRRALRRLDEGDFNRKLGRENKRWVERTAVPEMQRKAPRGATGKLSRSPRGSRSAKAARIMVGSEVRVPYAGPINFGWPARGIRAQEFIYSSITRTDEKWEDSYIKALNKLLHRAFPEGRL